MKVDTYLTFRVGSEYFAANVSTINNIIEYTQITKVPKMPSYLLGVINLRGSVLPVIDSRIKLGISDTRVNKDTCILVLEITKEQKLVGLLVDSVSEVLEIDDGEIKEAPSMGSTINNEFIDGIYHHQDHFIMILDIKNVILSNSKSTLDKISDVA